MKIGSLLAMLVAFIALGFAVFFGRLFLGAKRLQPMTHAISHLEHNARKVITPEELQAWATNLLANPVTGGLATDIQFKSNFPPALLALYPWRAPEILFEEGPPQFIQISWGGHDTGICAFEIGHTNFAGVNADSKWKDGVYFWSENPQKSE